MNLQWPLTVRLESLTYIRRIHIMNVRLLSLLVGLLLPAAAVAECPFCPSVTLTMAEQVAQADAVVLVEWKSAAAADNKNKSGNTDYEIVQAVRDPLKSLVKGQTVSIAGYRVGRAGDLSLLLGSKGMKIDWAPPIEVTETVFNYIVQAPSPEVPTEKRLEYFLKFLEYPDPTISADAFSEIANAEYKHIVLLTPKLPREKLRKWLSSKDLPEVRLGLYGLLLGLCGKEEDLALMESKIAEPGSPQAIRMGIDGVIGGYLLLAGDKGLEFVEKKKLADRSVPFSETYSAMKALEFMWTFGEGKVTPDKLKAAMRIVLDRPELADLVIADLARWKDWSVMDRVVALFGEPQYDIPSIRRAVVRYLYACTKDLVKDKPEGPHVAAAKKRIEEIRQRDPKTVKDVERFSL
jgi:hypothetical protein